MRRADWSRVSAAFASRRPRRCADASDPLIGVATIGLAVEAVRRPGPYDVTMSLSTSVPARLVAIGLVAGLMSAIFGVGGGIVIVPLLLLLCAFPPREAAAASLGAIMITALAGVALYAARGEVRVGYAALVGIPATIGAIGGAALQQRVSAALLMSAFAAFLAGLGVWMIAG